MAACARPGREHPWRRRRRRISAGRSIFVSDCLAAARRFRILVVVDDFTRECLAAVADTSISGTRVARGLDALVARRGAPMTIVSDNGPELTSRAILAWTNRAGLDWHYIAPGKPQQNAIVESLIGRLRDEKSC